MTDDQLAGIKLRSEMSKRGWNMSDAVNAFSDREKLIAEVERLRELLGLGEDDEDF